jgi:hypothetical protein
MITNRRTTRRKKLPPDIERMNRARAAWAQQALDAFMSATCTDPEDAICDLTANLMHLCDELGWDFAKEVRRGQVHYRAETGGEGAL